MFNYSILIILFLLNTSIYAEDSQYKVPIKKRATKANVLAVGSTIGIAESTQDTDLFDGNNSYGFFKKNISESQIICRLKTKIQCDYGFDSFKPIKNKKISLKKQNIFFEFSTDTNGEVDVFIKCNNKMDNEVFSLSIDSYTTNLKLSEFPKKISLNQSDCKLIK